MLRDDINNAVKEAMKAKNERKLSTLRMVNSTIKNADIDARGQGKSPLSDSDTVPCGGMSMPSGSGAITITSPSMLMLCTSADAAAGELTASSRSSALPWLMMVR